MLSLLWPTRCFIDIYVPPNHNFSKIMGVLELEGRGANWQVGDKVIILPRCLHPWMCFSVPSRSVSSG